MELEQAIRGRRTIRMLSTEANVIDRHEIYQLLESASFAPFHSKQEPWTVTIISDEKERKLFSDQMLASYERLGMWDKYDPEMLISAKQKTIAYFQEVPVIVVVTAPIEENKKRNLEAISAVAAFIQNFQLLAWAKQLGVTWRTTGHIFDEEFKRGIGINGNQQIIGLLYITRIDDRTNIPTARRTPIESWATTLTERLEGKVVE